MKSKKKTKSSNIPSIALLVVLAIIIVILTILVFGNNGFSTKRGGDTTTPTVTPTPRPSPRPLTKGKETLSYSVGPMAVGPKISEFSLDPLDSTIGQKQIITVKMSDTAPITSVTARLDTDNKKANLVFTKTAGTDLSGTWQATRTEDDTHDYTYYLDFTLVSDAGTYNGGFAFR